MTLLYELVEAMNKAESAGEAWISPSARLDLISRATMAAARIEDARKFLIHDLLPFVETVRRAASEANDAMLRTSADDIQYKAQRHLAAIRSI